MLVIWAGCSGEEGVKPIPAVGAQALAQLPKMHVATQKHALHTRCPGNSTFEWQGLAVGAQEDAVAIKWNCLQVVRWNFELEWRGDG